MKTLGTRLSTTTIECERKKNNSKAKSRFAKRRQVVTRVKALDSNTKTNDPGISVPKPDPSDAN
jgi:hypothetical protein